MRVGFVGMGAMGRPMAARLLAAGHALSVWARRPQSAAGLVADGARWCATPRQLAAESEVVITIVTTAADVESVVFGDDGLAAGFAAGSVLVDMSTVSPAAARRLAATLAERGVATLDAPVSGGAVGAGAGTLSIMVGGDAAVVDRVAPLFAVLGQTLVHVGTSGAGQVAKACNQMVMVGAIQAAAEALRLVAAAGVDVGRARAAMGAGSAASRVLEVFGGRMESGDFAAGVEARLHHKDFAIVLQEAHDLGAATPLAALVWQQLNALMAQGWGRQDSSRLLGVLAMTGEKA